ncbi:MAG TPA: DoxX family protein [Anaeromyxobacter sp.]|nr:DoxX family protein [Anaeromyxobacter sp.]
MAMTMSAKELSLVPARGALGATMLYHGAQKLRAEGARQSAPMFESLGFKPGDRWAMLTGLAEVVGGATAILGIGTRIGALAVLATQGVAIWKVHAGKGFDNVAGGYEFNLLLMAAALGLFLSGPGTLSAHEVVERRLEGPAGWLRRARPRRAVRMTKLLK